MPLLVEQIFLIGNGTLGNRIQILSDSKDAKQLNGSTFHAW